jgi:hypothetical protein
MKNKVTIMDLKQALWDKRFQDLFPESAEQIKSFLKDPGCGCNMTFLRSLLKYKDRLQSYFPTKEVITPEEEEAERKAVRNDWKVINCNVFNLNDRLKEVPKGKRMMAASRFRDKITVVVNDIDAIFAVSPTGSAEDVMQQSRDNQMNWKIINTTIHELEKELNKLPSGRKIVQIARFQDQVTAIVNDLNSLF